MDVVLRVHLLPDLWLNSLLGLLRHRLVVVFLAVSAWTCELIVGLVHPNLNSHYTYWAFLVLVPIFLTGSLLYLYRERSPIPDG